MKKVLLIYIPALHQGYLDLIEKIDFDELYLLNPHDLIFPDLIEKDSCREYLQRSFLHAVEPKKIKSMLETLMKDKPITLVRGLYDSVIGKPIEVILPEDDVSKYIASDFLIPNGMKYEFVDGPFLRWSKGIPSKESEPISQEIEESEKEFITSIIQKGYEESERSSDWWRRVGSVLFNEETKEILFSGFNKHLPDGVHQSTFGEARSSFSPGESPDVGTAIHAEQSVFMQALRAGVSADGLSLYSTTYPCPVCAKLISQSGIKKVYYTEGYSVMEQAGSVMRAFGVEIIHVPYNKK